MSENVRKPVVLIYAVTPPSNKTHAVPIGSWHQGFVVYPLNGTAGLDVIAINVGEVVPRVYKSQGLNAQGATAIQVNDWVSRFEQAICRGSDVMIAIRQNAQGGTIRADQNAWDNPMFMELAHAI